MRTLENRRNITCGHRHGFILAQFLTQLFHKLAALFSGVVFGAASPGVFFAISLLLLVIALIAFAHREEWTQFWTTFAGIGGAIFSRGLVTQAVHAAMVNIATVNIYC